MKKWLVIVTLSFTVLFQVGSYILRHKRQDQQREEINHLLSVLSKSIMSSSGADPKQPLSAAKAYIRDQISPTETLVNALVEVTGRSPADCCRVLEEKKSFRHASTTLLLNARSSWKYLCGTLFEVKYPGDNFDQSVSLESSSGEFLGECGIQVVTEDVIPTYAYNLWLFDKEDWMFTVNLYVIIDQPQDHIYATLVARGIDPVDIITLQNDFTCKTFVVDSKHLHAKFTFYRDEGDHHFFVSIDAWDKDKR